MINEDEVIKLLRDIQDDGGCRYGIQCRINEFLEKYDKDKHDSDTKCNNPS